MRIVFLGSGAFGLPTLEALHAEHEIVLVISQPDRPAGRGRRPAPTPVAAFAADAGLPCERPEDPNAPPAPDLIAAARPDALVVIAYGHKLGPKLLADRFAVNLHASLLPAYRGAAPINWAIIRGERETGVSVITLAETMDAGLVLGRRTTAIGPGETAGELHDRLAALGPEVVLEVLAAHAAGTLRGEPQDPAGVTWARRLRKSDGTVHFDQPAAAVRARIHGLTPWPGCRVELAGQPLRVNRVEVVDEAPTGLAPGEVGADGLVACRPGAVRLLEVQPAGGRVMPYEQYERGHPMADGATCRALGAE
ncbi:MAG: methionyl-tRNA formyltransferase [Planctomycetota bacterium]|jgi:methionyl-tRNA formyltransferase